MNVFNTLKAALSYFTLDLQLSYEDAIGALEISIVNGHINKIKLKEEYQKALSDPNFGWASFCVDNNLLSPNDSEKLSDQVAKDYIRSLIYDYVLF